MTGKFITLEGGEGSGKSTQLLNIFNIIRLNDLDCIKTREPGGSAGAEEIRKLLVSGTADKWDSVTETLLFYAARVDHVHTLIIPSLERGAMVLCDRFTDSTQVYQGTGKGLPPEFIHGLHHLTLGKFKPDLTFILDIDPTLGLKRALSRAGQETRFESMDIAFHQAVRNGFLSIARKEPMRCFVIDASQPEETVTYSIITIINQTLGLNLKLL